MYTFYCTVLTLLLTFPNTSPALMPVLSPGRVCSALLFSDFVEEKKIKDKKKNMIFFA
jgi:hypothetical protein